jgi:hypothetical protein
MTGTINLIQINKKSKKLKKKSQNNKKPNRIKNFLQKISNWLNPLLIRVRINSRAILGVKNLN